MFDGDQPVKVVDREELMKEKKKKTPATKIGVVGTTEAPVNTEELRTDLYNGTFQPFECEPWPRYPEAGTLFGEELELQCCEADQKCTELELQVRAMLKEFAVVGSGRYYAEF